MRLAILLSLIVFFPWSGIAQNRQTKEETVKWLREKLTLNDSIPNKNGNRLNSTKMCVNVNLLPDAATESDATISKNFKDKIVSHVSWKQDEIDIQNDIFIKGKLRETYTYQVLLTAIVSAKITNCQRSGSVNANAYVHRPIFIAIKKNTTRVGSVSFDKNGRAISSKAQQYHLNSEDVDWDSIIPIAGNWDSNAALQSKIVKAFDRLGEFNEREYSSR